MKIILTALLSLIFLQNSFATDFYFSSSGSDANLGTLASPWQTIAKFNSVFASKLPGDRFLFKRGDTFYGTLRPSRSGTLLLPITIGAYGTGDQPIITGFTDVVAWTNLGSNIWESSLAVSTLSTCNMVTINGINTAMGRTPNYPSYYIWQSRSGNTSITSTNLNSAVINWTGAEMCFFTTTYRTNRHPITAQSGSTITYNSTGNADFFQNPSTFFIQNFLIQNDPRTLDVQNEWYYNPSSKRIRMFSTSIPTGVKIASVDTLLWTGNFHDYLNINNLTFNGCNQDAFELGASKNIRVTSCNFFFCGKNAVYGANWGNPGYINFKIDSCVINQTNNCGIDISRFFYADTISHNSVKNIGLLIGMGYPTSANLTVTASMSTGIFAGAPDGKIFNNVVDSTGMIGLRYNGSHTWVYKNFVNHTCMGNGIKDGGAIYTGAAVDSMAYSGIKVFNNIAGNTGAFSHLIYFDDNSNGIECYNNTSFNGVRGIYTHSNFNINVHNNLTYNTDYGLLTTNLTGTSSPTNYFLRSNIFFQKTSSQICGYLDPSERIFPVFSADSNYYCRPAFETNTMQYRVGTAVLTRSFLQYQTAVAPQEAHSHNSPISVTDTSKLKLVYNPNDYDSTVILGAIYVDARNVTYNNTILLHAFTGAALMYSSALINTPPTANAGPDQIITTSSTTLSGSGMDTDGTIVSYSWTRISGPGSAVITSPSSAITTVTGLSAGTHVFQLLVTDNNGATGTDNMQVLVNVIPTVSAGPDQTITLPTSSITFAGSATDVDGTIASTLWTQISGPATATITTPSSLTSTATGLVAGVYVFNLLATDNNGASNSDQVQITVNPAPANNPPVSNAGADSTITLPRDSVHLFGHGTDSDGTIIGYNWLFVSGPNTPTISTPNDSNTVILGMIAGIYKFRLRVIDNQGSIASDTVQVTVNPAPNVPPTANAGIDQNISTSNSTLIGSGNDTDGSIVSYVWTQLSGPNTASIAFPSNATTAVNGMITGTYVFQLMVTDNDGGTATDTMNMVVNYTPPPADIILIIIHGNFIFTK